MPQIARPVRIDPAFDDREHVLALFHRCSPYPVLGVYVPDGVVELFDVKNDPKELKNLVGDSKYTAQLARMRLRLEALKKANGGPYSRENFPLLPKKGARSQSRR